MKTAKLKDISKNGVTAHIFEFDLKDGDLEMEAINIVPFTTVSVEVTGLLDGVVGIKQSFEDDFVFEAKDFFGSELVISHPSITSLQVNAPFLKPYVVGKCENLKIKIFGKGL